MDDKITNQVTADRLLASAGEVFADKGFKSATVREICRRAGANIAAVHYHFGDKRNLYLAVFQGFVDRLWREHPLPEAISQPVPAEQRLEEFVRSALHRLLEPGRPEWLWKLAVREMSDPTDAMDLVVERLSRPLFRALIGIVRELLGSGAGERMVRMCASSVVGQCFFYRFGKLMIERLAPDVKFDGAEIDRLAGHIARFSLAAIDAMKSKAMGAS